MSKVAVVYWSGTGNTEMMANEVAEGAKAAGAEVSVFTPDTFSADKMDEFDAVAFGCPAMGAEELEDTEFEPMFMTAVQNFPAKRSLFSVLTAGETASGCRPGKVPAKTTEQSWLVTA